MKKRLINWLDQIKNYYSYNVLNNIKFLAKIINIL